MRSWEKFYVRRVTMYVPAHFTEERAEVLHDLIRETRTAC